MVVGRVELARTFFRIGLTAYGGPAIVAQIREVVVLEKGWVSEGEFQESLAFCQMLPGPTAVQTAAHLGWRLRGGAGAFVALGSYMLPAFVLMIGLSAAYFRLGHLPAVDVAFRGLGAVIVAIVAHSILTIGRQTLTGWRAVAIAAASGAGFFGGLSPLAVLAAAAAAGVALGLRGAQPQGAPLGEGEGRGGAAPGGSSATSAVAVSVVVAAFAALVLGSGAVSPALPALGAVMVKINLLSFGGGYTAVALMYHDFVADPSGAWLTQKEFIDGLALGQVTPGPVIVTATFVGYRVAGWLGACFSTLCVFFPSSLLLVILAPRFERLRRVEAVQRAVRGLLAAFVAMLCYVLAEVARGAFTALWAPAAALAALVALELGVNVVWLILAALAGSLAFLR